MKRLIAAFLMALLLPAAALADQSVYSASIIFENYCSGTMISSYIVMTASHCTGTLGASHTIHFRDGSSARAIVIWDTVYLPELSPGNAGLDLSFLFLERPADVWTPIATEDPPLDATVYTVGNSSGLQWWAANLEYRGEHRIEELGDVFVYLGLIAPGSSGSCVYYGGACIGIITHYTRAFSPPLFLGAGRTRLTWAWNDLMENGIMALDSDGAVYRIK